VPLFNVVFNLNMTIFLQKPEVWNKFLYQRSSGIRAEAKRMVADPISLLHSVVYTKNGSLPQLYAVE